MEKGVSTPNQTIYVNNLNEKIKVDELKASIFQLFNQYGEVVEIIASKTIKRRGQAFVVYKNIDTAMKAKDELNGSVLFGKRINVAFARTKSDYTMKSLGLLTNDVKLKKQNERKNRREQEYKVIRERIMEQRDNEYKSRMTMGMAHEYFTQQRGNGEENHILFVEDLPQDIEEGKLISVFDKYSGFKELRLQKGRGIAFVEYDNEINAGSALVGLYQMCLDNECILNISYAKKE